MTGSSASSSTSALPFTYPSCVPPYEPHPNRVEDLTGGNRKILKEIRVAGSATSLTSPDGSSIPKPCYGDRVQINYFAYFPDGTVFDASRDKFEFTLGKGDVIKALDIGVATMTKGEVAIIYCMPEYAYGEVGNPPRIGPDATLVYDVELCDWNAEDLSKNKDRSITRRQLIKGAGYSSPTDGATVDRRHEGRVFDERDVTFVLNNKKNAPKGGVGDETAANNVVKGVKLALEHFQKGETSLLTLAPRHAFGETGNHELGVPPNATVEYEVTLARFEIKGKEIWEMDTLDKLEQAAIFKDKGTDAFRGENYNLALQQYQLIVDYMNYEANVEEADLRKRCRDMRLAALLNVALCHLKLKQFNLAKDACDGALEIDPLSEKALFRRGQAHLATSDFELSLQDFTQVLTIDPNNRAASSRIVLCNDKVKESRQKEKQTYGNMFAKFAERDREREIERNRLQADVLVNPGTWEERNSLRINQQLEQQLVNENNPLMNVQILGTKNGTFW